MIRLILIGPSARLQHTIEGMLKSYDDIEVVNAFTKWKALDLMAEQHFDLAVIDEFVGKQSGAEVAEKLVTIDPMMNCALLSPLSEEEFHEMTEGLGILAQLSLNPAASEIDQLVEKVRKLLVYSS